VNKTLDELTRELQAIEQVLDQRITVTRIIIDETGRELFRFSRSIQQPRDPHNGPQQQERRP
jgi:hypothetical protein